MARDHRCGRLPDRNQSAGYAYLDVFRDLCDRLLLNRLVPNDCSVMVDNFSFSE